MRTIQFRAALREAMIEEMERDAMVFLMGEEVAAYNGAYKVSQGMLERFGAKRVIDTPISELGFTGLGIGAAMNGLRPIIELMTFNFSLVAIDQIVNGAAKIYAMSGGQYHVPIVFRGPTGNAGMLGAQHSQNFENWYANCPGLKVIVPSNPYDAKGLLKSAIRDDDPVLFMESELMYGDLGEVPADAYLLPIGKAHLRQEGTDITLVSFGKMVKIAEEAVQVMQTQGVSVELIDLRTIRPLDLSAVIASVKKTNRLVIVEEAWPLASIASEIAYQVQKHAFDYLDAPIQKINNLDVPLPYAPTLIEAILPNVAQTVAALKRVLYLT
ncbi:MAG: pyruvate dehydrogenase complex E1 component subunit beta [Candidatus Cardinium sp.]|uniref:pyruvate dehydrogenase complex E1 component subunit beta n=1 Tax=Candidatus Cardinium sp. TP TaxID=2961955 RepID=UPI0021AE6493|nr:pyruvate dehydrogenase complex E1 component subunit beta [Candidatus Cardinium sp. TP]MCT4697117.1 pyruvate dehydrogenase complex E1 component subunit beta [Candidatus Cardinium sp. TP]MDN5247110.1 pyruvate dehydrogenase complex E1 component subunit beta [Candidatus Cardinium sp.]